MRVIKNSFVSKALSFILVLSVLFGVLIMLALINSHDVMAQNIIANEVTSNAMTAVLRNVWVKHIDIDTNTVLFEGWYIPGINDPPDYPDSTMDFYSNLYISNKIFNGYEYIGYKFNDGELNLSQTAIVNPFDGGTVKFYYRFNEAIFIPTETTTDYTTTTRISGHLRDVWVKHIDIDTNAVLFEGWHVGGVNDSTGYCTPDYYSDFYINKMNINGYEYIGYKFNNEELNSSQTAVVNPYNGGTVKFYYRFDEALYVTTITESPPEKGDIGHDKINGMDLLLAKQHILNIPGKILEPGSELFIALDFNNDGVINGIDLLLIKKAIFG